MRYLLPCAFAALLLGCQPSAKETTATATPFNEPPAWAQDAIWYQVFPERFANGDTSNDPTAASCAIPLVGMNMPANWHTTPWTQDWYQADDYTDTSKSFNSWLQYRRFGGDLQGLLDKLDYLQDLGVNALYINPLNHAPSLHKYDASSYHHIDANMGPDPAGDLRIMAAEDPGNPETWQWTAADKLFLKLVDACHQRGMRVVMDFSWNHTGTTFWAFQDILKNGAQSKYKDWYSIKQYDDPATAANEFAYDGWIGVASLPELKKVDIRTERKTGHPYEGDINAGAKAHIFAVTKRWLAPDGDTSKGINGYRMDVADQIGLQFWRDWRKEVRRIKTDAYIVGEIWWEQWPDRLMDPTPYCKGDIFDAVMFYQAYKPARYFFAKTDYAISAAQLRDSLQLQWNRLNKTNQYAMMNVSSSHDAPRLLTDFANNAKYKFRIGASESPDHLSGKPNEETYQRVRLYLLHLFTSVGAPQIWNGEEMGMWGGDDPDCRKPLWWPSFSFSPETRTNYQPVPKLYDSVGFNTVQHQWYKKLAALRQQQEVLRRGDIAFEYAEGQQLMYRRYLGNQQLWVVMNSSNAAASISLPAGNYTDLLTGASIKAGTALPALSGWVLQKQ